MSFSFRYTNNIFVKGYKEDLNVSDLYETLEDLTSYKLASDLKRLHFILFILISLHHRNTFVVILLSLSVTEDSCPSILCFL